MAFQIDPPLDRDHKIAITLMALAGIVAIVLVDALIEFHLRAEAREWATRDLATRERTVDRHGRR